MNPTHQVLLDLKFICLLNKFEKNIIICQKEKYRKVIQNWISF